MVPIRDLALKPVTVAGAGRSGLAVIRFLLGRRARVRVTDTADTPALRKTLDQLREEFPRGELIAELGGHTPASLDGSVLVVTSPGVKPDAAPLRWAREQGLPLVGELEFASWFCPCPIVAVTGTNGKSTLTTLIGELLTAAGRPVAVCGNIGFPLTAALRTLTVAHTAVVEVSSFQLEHVATFHPHIGVLLNITPNHLDHHASLEEYAAMKYRLFAQQTADDIAVLNADDPRVAAVADQTAGRVMWWGQSVEPRNGLTGLPLGWHPAYRVGELLEIPSSVMRQVFARFRGLSHRQELVAVRDGVRFINDSKSTTPASVQWALESVDGPVVLIAGGRNKGLDFAPVAETIARLNRDPQHPRVRAAVCIGEAREALARQWRAHLPVMTAETLPAAIAWARAQARPGDAVLLSPGCASFDMFQNFEDRGEQFRAAVQALPAAPAVAASTRAVMPSSIAVAAGPA